MDPITHTPDASASATLVDPSPRDGTPERPCACPTQPRNKRPEPRPPVPPPVVPDTTTGVEVIVATTSSDVATQAGAVMSPHASAKSSTEEEEKGELRPEIMTVPVVLVRASHAGGLAVPLNSD
ncbi:unnamed protein product [Peronospora farinosa]|uniref:Uncharacterized protein n=1 Tax=Peronospora farinosa TaxID=134698 RepID=A0AAV0UEZ6_9STRA|nr:unnamed protein product [Peronospora farinosa]